MGVWLRHTPIHAFKKLFTQEVYSFVPDIAVFTWERVPLDAAGEPVNKIEIAPDWVIEILSPEQSTARVLSKISICLEAGSQLGWLIDPQERLILVLQRDHLLAVKENNDRLSVLDCIPNWQPTVAEIFQMLSFV